MKSKWVFCGSVGACVLVRTALVVDTEVKFYCDISVLHSPSCHTHTHTPQQLPRQKVPPQESHSSTHFVCGLASHRNASSLSLLVACFACTSSVTDRHFPHLTSRPVLKSTITPHWTQYTTGADFARLGAELRSLLQCCLEQRT